MKHKVEGAPLCAQGSCLGAASPFRKGKQTKGKHPNKTCLDCVVRAVHNSILKTNLPYLRRLEKLEHESEHKSMTEVSARRCMKEFAHPSIYYDMTWDIWVYWSGIIALERGADSTILWGGRVISGPSTDTAFPLSAQPRSFVHQPAFWAGALLQVCNRLLASQTQFWAFQDIFRSNH